MKIFGTLLVMLQMSMAFAAVPEGFWYADPMLADDGAYGAYYKGWLVISDKEMDQIITLGAHYDKKKFQITNSDSKSLELFDPEEKSVQTMSYSSANDVLTACFGGGNCKDYKKVSQGPQFSDPPMSYPRIQIVSKWCVENDCVDIEYTEHQSESLFNLYSGFKPAVFRTYPGPDEFLKKYDLQLNMVAFSYRFANDGTKLSSFATSLTLMAANKNNSAILGKSGVQFLREGQLALLMGAFDQKKISVEFRIRPR